MRQITKAELETFWKKVVSDHMGVAVENIKSDSTFVEDLGSDSLDGVELTVTAEEEFNISIPDGDTDSLRTFGESLKYLEDRLTEEGTLKP